MASDDPFLEVQSDVQTLLKSTRPLYSSYLRIRTLASTRSNTRTSPTTELLQSRAELTSNLDTLTSDLSDLEESIRAIMADPYRFGVDVAEVGRRRAWVRGVRGEVGGMRGQLEGHGGDGTNLPDPDAFHHNTGDTSFSDDENQDPDTDSYAANEQHLQSTMFREQDSALDDVSRTVGTLRHQAMDMGRELEEQGVMLGEVDTLADRVGGKLEVGRRRVGEVLRRGEERWGGCCVGVLIVVLVVLLVLVIII